MEIKLMHMELMFAVPIPASASALPKYFMS